MPALFAASIFSLRPPIPRILPVKVISPVIAISCFTFLPVNREARAVVKVIPAEGPSLGTAPEGK